MRGSGIGYSNDLVADGQRQALEAALNDAPLAESLAILARTASARLGPGVRAAFYLANPEGTALHHVVGMTADYAKAVDGFPIGPESLSCGLAVHSGEPILTADVMMEPLWTNWRWLAAKTGFRGCWSFPIHTTTRKFVGTLAVYWPQPCEATSEHREVVATLTQVAGIIVARHSDSQARERTEQSLRDAHAQLQSELAERQRAEFVMRQRAERMELLSETLAQLLAAHDPDSIVRELFPKVARHLNSDTYFNYMMDDSARVLRLHSYAGVSEETAREIEQLALGQAICGTVAQTRSPIHATDIQHSAYEKAALVRTFGIQCYACNPLLAGDRLLGTLSFASRSRTAFDQEELKFLRNVAQHTAVALDRLLSAKRLRENQELLTAIVETTPECIKIVASDGIVLQMNQVGRQMVEASTPAQVEGACIFDVIAPEHREEWKSNHDKVCSGEKLSWEFDIIGLRGTRRHMETHAAPIQMPDGSWAQVAITRDVTKRKEDDQRIKDTERRFAQLLQALPAAVYTTDADGRITFYNDAAVEFAGRVPELGQKWCVTWRLFNPDGSPLPHEQCPMAIALKEQRPVRDIEAIAERPDGSRRWFVPYPTPLRDSRGVLNGAINMLVDITQHKNAERRQKLLVDELNHRVKNTLATVQSLIVQTAKNAETIDDYRNAIQDRIMAMSRAHSQLSRNNWNAADLGEIMRSGLEAYLETGRLAFSGEPMSVPPRAALMLSMIFNELATNAVKYGALSRNEGKIKLAWSVKANGAGPVLRLHWCESGGPDVRPRTRTGFGMRLIERGIEGELGGKAIIDFAPSGLRCEIEIPLVDGQY